MSVQLIAKVASSPGKVATSPYRIQLLVCRQVLFCIAISYLQLMELQKSSKAMKGTEPLYNQNQVTRKGVFHRLAPAQCMVFL